MRLFKYTMMMMAVFLAVAGKVYAINDINVTTNSGPGFLDFGVVSSTQNVSENANVAMQYDGSLPYNVYYEVVQNFTNGAGITLDPDALTFHTVVGSNQYGILHHTTDGPIQMGQQILYSSGATPHNDDFDILYTAHGPEANGAGIFTGVIRYKMLSVDGNIQVTEDLIVIIDFDLDLVVTVTGSTSSSLVHMVYPQNPTPEHAFTISFSGNTTGQEVKIIQDFVTMPQSGNGTYLNNQAVKFHTALGNNGTKYYTSPSVLSIAPQLLYTSMAPSDTLKVIFEFFPPYIGNQQAGTYITTVTYKVEWAGNVYLFDMQFEVEILPIFELVVTPGANVQQTGDGAYILGIDLTPLSGNKEITMTTAVNSNLGTSYKVMHNMMTPLTNVTTSFQIPNNLLKFKTELLTGLGNPQYPVLIQVPMGVTVPVLISHFSGASASMRITYRLALTSATSGIEGGEYRAPFVLTLIPD